MIKHRSKSPDNGAKKNVTLQDIADRCGVTKITVSRAVGEQSYKVKAETLQRIQAVATELGYDPSLNHFARRMAFMKSGVALLNHVVAVFFPEAVFTMPYYLRLYSGISDMLTQKGYSLLMSTYHPVHANTLLPIFTRGEIDGAIVLSQEVRTKQLIHLLHETTGFGKRPIVSLIEPALGCSSIVSDDRYGGYLLASHLLQLGHRYILHSCYDDYTHQQRLLGYREAYHERGFNPDDYLRKMIWKRDDYAASSTKLIQKLTHPDSRITAILAPHDLVAREMADTMRNNGIRIPEDISLAGFDDTEALFDSSGHNILTTIRVPLLEMGNEAARMLIRRLTGEAPVNISAMLPISLVERGSTILLRK